MIRVLVAELPQSGQMFQPDPEERHHLLSVRRIRTGERIEVLDGRGGLALGRVVTAAKKQLNIVILETCIEDRESPLGLNVGLAIPEHLGVLDQILPGLVQLGVRTLHLVPTVHSGRIKRDPTKYRRRLEGVARQALKQCGRLWLPRIDFLPSWTSLCNSLNGGGHAVLFHPHRGKNRLLPEACPNVTLLIGPEGGFHEDEVAEARAKGVHIRDLGPRMLRLETAVIGACFWAQMIWGDLGWENQERPPNPQGCKTPSTSRGGPD